MSKYTNAKKGSITEKSVDYLDHNYVLYSKQSSKIKIKSNFGNQINLDDQVCELEVQIKLIWSVKINLIFNFASWSSTQKIEVQFLWFEVQPKKLKFNFCDLKFNPKNNWWNHNVMQRRSYITDSTKQYIILWEQKVGMKGYFCV